MKSTAAPAATRLDASQGILLWGGGFVNKGAEAMLRTVEQQLRARLGPARFCLESIPAERERVLAGGGMPFPRSVAPWEEAWERPWYRFVRGFRLARPLRGVGAMLDISGYAYGGRGCARGTWRSLAVAERLHRAGRPVVLLPQAFGPFHSERERVALRRLLDACARVYVRDAESLCHLKEVASEYLDRIVRAPDIAFCFDCGASLSASSGEAALRRPGRGLLAIAPNMRVYERSRGRGLENEYLQLVLAVAEHASSRLGCDLLLVPHELRLPGDSLPDDRFLVGLLREALAARDVPGVTAITEGSAEEIKRAVGRCDLLVGSRFHALIAATSQFIPAVALGWSHKYQGLLSDVGLSEYALAHEDANLATVIDRISRAWQNRERLREVLRVRVAALQLQVQGLFDEVAGLLERAAGPQVDG